MKEVSHVKHMHADSLLIHPSFSSKLMITWLNFFENPLLIRFQTDQKLNFDPVRSNESGSKMSFRTIHGHVIDKLLENSILIHLHYFELDQNWVFDQFENGSKVGLSHVMINFEEKLGWTKIESTCICFTWLTSFTYFTGPKFGPPRTRVSARFN